MKWKNLPSDISIYFITATITEWQPVFRHDPPRQILLADLEFCRRKYEASIFGYVIMPEHYHILLGLRNPEQLPDWLWSSWRNYFLGDDSLLQVDKVPLI